MTLKEDLKKGKIDLAALPAGKRERVKRFLRGDKRALRKRDKVLGLRFASEDIASWHEKAAKHDESITEYIERVMNAAS
jgi:predicted DNA binding CopG/RHH family protein